MNTGGKMYTITIHEGSIKIKVSAHTAIGAMKLLLIYRGFKEIGSGGYTLDSVNKMVRFISDLKE